MKIIQKIQMLLPAMAPLLLLSIFAVTVVAQPAHAVDTAKVCELIVEAGEECRDDETLRRVIAAIVDILSVITGAVSVIMIIVGGLRYIVSAGDSSRVVAAKNTILYALVGLVIVIFAQTIVAFVVGRVSE